MKVFHFRALALLTGLLISVAGARVISAETPAAEPPNAAISEPAVSPDADQPENAVIESEPPAGAAEAEPSEPEAIPLTGERLEFAATAFESKCSICHESDGNADDTNMNLVDKVWRHGGSLAQIEKTIREGVPDTTMKAQKDGFSPEQIADLAVYVQMLTQMMHVRTEESEREAATELTNQIAAQSPPSSPADVEIPENFIDDHIFGKMTRDGIPHAKLCGDNEFIRRIYLDLWGRLPDAEAVRTFVADTNPEKRNELIERLLGLDFMDKPGNDDYKGPWLVEEPFLSKWTYFFCDLYRTGSIRTYIRLCLLYDLPYDYVVRQMLTETALGGEVSGSAGYLMRHQVDGIRCADIMHEDTCDEIGLHTTKAFLGVNLECISCHDGYPNLKDINLWLSKRKRVEFWRQAAFFGNLRIIRGTLVGNPFTLLDGPPLRPENIWQGKIASPEDFNTHFEFTSAPTVWGGMGYRMEAPSVLRTKRDPTADVFPEFILTQERPRDGVNWRVEYARMITTHPQFAKATANLIWSKFMTVGIVDPPLDWDLARQDPENPPPPPWTIQPSHPEFLDALGRYFQSVNFDLRLLMRAICRSKAYQLSSHFEGEYKPEYDRYYARKLARRLSAEEIYDALCKATNVFGHGIEYVMASGGPPGDAELKRFLDFFGQSNRLTKQADNKSSVIQASLMLNSDVVKKKILSGAEGSTLDRLLHKEPVKTNVEIVEELFLATLARFPTTEELNEGIRHLEMYRNRGAEDLQWALVNKLEFIVNY